MKLTGDTYFDRFYQAYPKHEAPKKAHDAWKKAIKDEDKEEFTTMVVLAIDAQKRERRAKQNKGIWMADWPMPATWLNQGRWDDEIDSSDHIEKEAKKYTCECGKEGRYPAIGKLWCARCYTNKFTKGLDQLKAFMPDEMRKLKSETKEDWLKRHKSYGASRLSLAAEGLRIK